MRKILAYIPLHYLGLSDIPIFSYGFMMMLAFLSAIFIARRQAVKDGIDPDKIYDISFIAILSGIIGSRLLWVILFSPKGTWSSLYEIVAVWNGGLVYYGGLILSLFFGGIYVKKKKLPVGLTIDCFAPGMAIGIFFGRIGCFLNGCCFGKTCSLDAWYGVRFPAGSPASFHQYGMAAFQNIESQAVYPTQLISSFGGLITFLLILALFKYRKFPGQMTLYFLQIYGLFRFFIEYLRDDTVPYFSYGSFGGFKAGQIVAIITVLFASAMMNILKKKHSAKISSNTEDSIVDKE